MDRTEDFTPDHLPTSPCSVTPVTKPCMRAIILFSDQEGNNVASPRRNRGYPTGFYRLRTRRSGPPEVALARTWPLVCTLI